MLLKKQYLLLLYGLWQSSFISGNAIIQGLPLDCTLVTMKKTVLNNALNSIDILFKNPANNHFFVQVSVAHFQNQNATIKAQTTQATFFRDSINTGLNKDVVVNNKISLNNHQLNNIPPVQTNSLHNKPIISLFSENNVIVTQSTYPNIRFWQIVPPGGFEKIKEISKSFLLHYENKHAVWAKKQLFNKNMLDIYIGFEFGPHSKSLLLKKDVHDFVIDKNVFSVPLIKNSFLPACWIEGDRIAIYNDRYKKIDIFQHITTTNNNKAEHRIDLFKTIQLSEIIYKKNKNIDTFLLYKTPFKIDYDNQNSKLILVYNDFIVKINVNNKTFSFITKSNYYWVIADAIIDNHKNIYVLWHHFQNNQWEVSKYLIQ
ncbi:hypothetical protein EKK58_02310 [Candidatus Dependentiae bacterium]|nr:MAG: hypothetical protein EKK58_02310 [Candidatus Dependentiae bacterium]